MHELLARLPAHAIVVDLGCSKGSFDASAYPCSVLRVDLEIPPTPTPPNVFRVQADAAMLPIRSEAVDLVICNHSLEHIENLEHCLREIGRVLKIDAPLFVSVPDASTFTDRVYRWLANGGGHVNASSMPDSSLLRSQRRQGAPFAEPSRCSRRYRS
jgi:SAM-dependent methyltransferase